MAKLTCKDCGTELLKLSPPLSKRIGADGQPMTRAEAICLFVDSRGGRCLDCYTKQCEKELTALMARHRADPSIRTRPWPDFGGFWKPKPTTV